MDITVTINDVDAFCGQYDRPAQIHNNEGVLVDNPETKEQFVARKVDEYVSETIIAYKVSQAADQARQTAIDAVKASPVSSVKIVSVDAAVDAIPVKP